MMQGLYDRHFQECLIMCSHKRKIERKDAARRVRVKELSQSTLFEGCWQQEFSHLFSHEKEKKDETKSFTLRGFRSCRDHKLQRSDRVDIERGRKGTYLVVRAVRQPYEPYAHVQSAYRS